MLISQVKSRRPLQSRRRTQTAGYTTIEVLVALAVFLLVGTVGIALFSGGDRARLKADGADIALALQAARLTALESGRNVEITVNEERSQIMINGELYELGRNVGVDADRSYVVLQPSGTSEGLRLQLFRGSETLLVELDWLTGRVRLGT